jgi:lipoate-protein ligase B
MDIEIFDLGLIDYLEAWKLQKDIFEKVNHHQLEAGLILCNHYPVITLGRQADKRNILISVDELYKKKIPVYEIERGGDVTYHGPGQLTVYPIFNLDYLKKDVHWFLRKLEEVIIDFLADFGINSQRQPGRTGVWIGNKKIASIGIAIKKWITLHGLSINIKKTDLLNFSLIKPCGMDIEMTSLENILAKEFEFDKLKTNLISRFRDVFNPLRGTFLEPIPNVVNLCSEEVVR